MHINYPCVGIIKWCLVALLEKAEIVEQFAVGTTAELESRQGRKREVRGKPAERATCEGVASERSETRSPKPLLTNKR